METAPRLAPTCTLDLQAILVVSSKGCLKRRSLGLKAKLFGHADLLLGPLLIAKYGHKHNFLLSKGEVRLHT